MLKPGDKVIITKCCSVECGCSYPKIGIFKSYLPNSANLKFGVIINNQGRAWDKFNEVVPYNKLTEVLYL